MKIRLIALLLISSAALVRVVAEETPPVQMAPFAVKAGPLGFIGIRLAASVGIFGLVSSNAHVRELVILDVLKDSAGQRAGLLAKDVILRIDGAPVTSFTLGSLREIGDKEKGDSIELVVRSPGSTSPRSVHVTLGARNIPPH